jgi:hypothetical protein
VRKESALCRQDEIVIGLHILLKISKRRGSQGKIFSVENGELLSEDLDYKGIINCTNAADLINIKKCLNKIQYEWENKFGSIWTGSRYKLINKFCVVREQRY